MLTGDDELEYGDDYQSAYQMASAAVERSRRIREIARATTSRSRALRDRARELREHGVRLKEEGRKLGAFLGQDR